MMARKAREDEGPTVEAARRVPLSLRTTPDLRANLVMSAHESGRSLAQEVEFRIEQSFQAERTMRMYDRLTYLAEAIDKNLTSIKSPITGELLRQLAHAIRHIEIQQGVSWDEEASNLDAYDMNLKILMQTFKRISVARAKKEDLTLADLLGAPIPTIP